MSSEGVISVQNDYASHGYETENIATNNVKLITTDHLTAPNSELPQMYKALSSETKQGQSDVKPLVTVTDLFTVPNSELPQKYETFTSEKKQGHYDVKPCVTELSIVPYSELPQKYETFTSETKQGHKDVKPCFADLFVSPNFEPSQVPGCNKKFPNNQRKARPNDEKACVTNLALVSNCESSPGHHTRHSPVPTCLIKNSVSRRGDLHKSNIDTFVSGNEDLENDIAGKPLDSWPQVKEEPGECQFRLEECDKLTKHTRTHRGEEAFKCNECGKLFSQNSQLHLHMRIHKGEKPFKCDVCGNTFSQKRYLLMHIRRIHTREMPFKCNECGKGFSQNSQLRLHMRIHTEEKPFKCNECGKTFSQNSYLLMHIGRIYTRERPLKCNECGKSFVRKSHLRLHMRSHEGEKTFKCNECGKSFIKICNLRLHMMIIHTGESHSSVVRVGNASVKPMKIHKGRKAFECNKCHKSYTRNYDLRRHLRTRSHRQGREAI